MKDSTVRITVLLSILTVSCARGSGDAAPDQASDAAMEIPEDTGSDTAPDGEAPDLPEWVERKAPGRYSAGCPGSDLSVFVLDEGILRLRYGKWDADQSERSYAVVARDWGDPHETAGRQGSDGFFLATGAMRIEVDRSGTDGKCRVTVFSSGDGKATAILEDPASGGYGPKAADGSVSVTRLVTGDEHFYGFGEKTGPLDKRGTRLVFRNRDPLAGGTFDENTDPVYQSIPFFTGLRGDEAYGVFTDNTFRMVFDMAAADPGLYRITADGGAIDQYVIAGPKMADVMFRYTKLTGRMPMPPRWTLGYHQCRWSYIPDTRVLEVAGEFRKRGIPADGIWLDIDYMDGFRSWTFDPARFPDPEGMVDQLEAINFKTTAIIDPGIKEDPGWDVYDEGIDGGHFLMTEDGKPFVGFVWPGPAVFPDFSRQATRDWWGSLVPRVLDTGIRGLWIDMNEPASFLADDGFTVPDEVLADGDGSPTTMAEAHNVYALNMARATYEGMMKAQPERRPFVLTRAGFAGEQRYTAVWTGDVPSNWQMLAGVLPMLMNLGLSGVAFAGSDVGGFSGGASPEMFARWMEVGAISPFFRGHVQTGAPLQEPWEFGVEVEDISRTIIGERYRHLPYLYSLFRSAHESGSPVLRPLVYEFQKDPQVRAIGDQAMLGPFLMFAPVVEEGAVRRRIYLPEGTWYELRSGREYEGPANIEPELPLGALAAYVRGGAVLPGSQDMQWSDQEPVNPLTLDVYPADEETSFTLYEDDGESQEYRDGAYSRVTYTVVRTADGSRLSAGAMEGDLSGKDPKRRILARVRRVGGPPSSVELDGKALLPVSGLDAVTNGEEGWWFDEPDGALLVNFGDRDDFVLDMAYPTGGQPADTVPMTFDVDVPPGTPKDVPVHIVGSWSEWKEQQALAWSPGGDGAHGVIEVPRGEWFYYKYTRGGWDTVEKWAGCVEANNRYAQGLVRPVKHDSVEAWADQCP